MSKKIKTVADITPEVMKLYGDLIKNSTPEGMGFALVLFDFKKEGLSELKYISNARRVDMINALEALVLKWKIDINPEINN